MTSQRLAHRVVELGDDRVVLGRAMIGTMSISGSLDMITPAACAPVADLALQADRGLVDRPDVRVRPWSDRNSPPRRSAWAGVEDVPERDALASRRRRALVIRSESAKPWSSTRAASLIAAWPSAGRTAIWATRSAPYLSVTYLMTSPRRWSSGSMSKSGIDGRSGLRKRSKKQAMLERARVGDAERVHAAMDGTGTTAGADPMLLRLDHWMKAGDHEVVAASSPTSAR